MDDFEKAHEAEPYRIRPRSSKEGGKKAFDEATPPKGPAAEDSSRPPAGNAGEAPAETPPRREGGKKAFAYGALFVGTLALTAALAFASAGAQQEMVRAGMSAASSAGEPVYTEEAPQAAQSGKKPEAAGAEDESTESANPSETQEQAASVHDHEWTDLVETFHHDAETKTVHHDAVYEQSVERHTVCNVCKAAIDGKTREHAAETGHEGYTTGVPVTVEKLVKDAYDEEVVVEEAYDEERVIGRECGTCGAVETYDEKE